MRAKRLTPVPTVFSFMFYVYVYVLCGSVDPWVPFTSECSSFCGGCVCRFSCHVCGRGTPGPTPNSALDQNACETSVPSVCRSLPMCTPVDVNMWFVQYLSIVSMLLTNECQHALTQRVCWLQKKTVVCVADNASLCFSLCPIMQLDCCKNAIFACTCSVLVGCSYF